MRPIRNGRPSLGGCLVLVACFAIDAVAGTETPPSLASQPSAAHRVLKRHSATPPATPSTDAAAATDRSHGDASFYAHHLSGRKTASGEAYDPNAMTAAHRTLPLGTRVKVVNPKNDRSVVVTVNDRGPVPKNRMIDVSSAAAEQLDMKKSGVTKVETQVVGKTDLPGAPSSKNGTDAR